MRGLNAGDFAFLFDGLLWTVGLSLATLVLGSIIAAGLVALSLFRLRIINALIYVYVGVFQGTPLIGQLFFFYFGLSIIGLGTSPFVSAVTALSLYSAAFLTEIWRGAIESVSRLQWEAGESLGLGKPSVLAYVVLPQALRSATPPTVGFLVQLIKDSSLASVIGFVELMRAAQIINNATFKPFVIFATVAVLYFCLCFPISELSRRLERRVTH